MSSTSSPAPFTGSSTATEAGTAGIGEVGVGAGVGATVGAIVAVGVRVGVGVGDAACCVHETNTSATAVAGANSLFIRHPSENGGILAP